MDTEATVLQVRNEGEEEEGSHAEQGVVDRVAQWKQGAAAQYADDGVADGWESDDSHPETAEQRYIRVRACFIILVMDLVHLPRIETAGPTLPAHWSWLDL